MQDVLYLDTARVGRPSPRTVQAAADSLALAAEEGGSAYFDRFLVGGLGACPPWMQARYAGLRSWRGVAALKADLRTLTGSTPELPVLLANRSAELMVLAARLFFPRCRNVLTCDLGWPAYESVLQRQASESTSRVSVAALRALVTGGRATAEEVVEAVSREFVSRGCDGLFLPAVSHLGVRLPVERIVRSIEARGEVRLVVVDGAQGFCHAGSDLAADYCDLYLAGCHKWLGGHHLMGVGFYGRRRTSGFIDTTLGRLLEAGAVDDPLLRFAGRDADAKASVPSETLNLAPLFTCQAAVSEAVEPGNASATLAQRLEARGSVEQIAEACGWQVERLDPAFRSGILLAYAPLFFRCGPALMRESFRQRGVSVTAYEGGFVRLSMPSEPMSFEKSLRLRKAFHLDA